MTVSTESGQDTQGPANAPGSASLPRFMTGFKHTDQTVSRNKHIWLQLLDTDLQNDQVTRRTTSAWSPVLEY